MFLTFQISNGLNLKADSKTLPPGQFTELENCSFDTYGSLTKRLGHTLLSSGTLPSGTLPRLLALGTRGDELVAFDENTIWSYSPAVQAWSQKVYRNTSTAMAGAQAAMFVETREVDKSSVPYYAPDHCRVGDLELHAWTVMDSTNAVSGTKWKVVDATTSTELYEGDFATYAQPKCLAIGGKSAFIVTQHPASASLGDLRMDYFNLSTLASPNQAVFANASTQFFLGFDAGTDGQGTLLTMNVSCSQSTAGGVDRDVVPFVSAVSGSSVSQLWRVVLPTGRGTLPIAMCTGSTTNSTGSIWALNFTFDGSGVSGFGKDLYATRVDWTQAAGTVGATTKVYSGSADQAQSIMSGGIAFSVPGFPSALGAVYNPTDGYVYAAMGITYGFADEPLTFTENDLVRLIKWPASSPGSATSTIVMRSCGLISKPFLHSGRVYVWTGRSSPTQPTAFCVRDDGAIVGKCLVNQLAGVRAYKWNLSLTANGTTVYSPGLPEVVEHAGVLSTAMEKQGELLEFDVTAADGTVSAFNARPVQTPRVVLSKTTFGADSPSLNTVEFNRNMYVAGAQVGIYDGRALTELGFHQCPEDTEYYLSATLGSGGRLSTGSYGYRFTYGWRDASGKEWMSRPSSAKVVTVTSQNTKVTWKVPSLRATNKPDAYVVGWRTNELTGSGADAENIFQRFTSPTLLLTNSRGSDYVTVDDILSDLQVSARSVLYTATELKNAPVPVAKTLAAWDNRIVLAGDELAPEKVWLSKQANEQTPPSFADALYLTFPDDSTPVTAVGTLDDKLVVFKQRNVYSVVPSDLDNNGGGSFPTKRRERSDVGCDQPKSLIDTGDQGLFFKSTRGIYRMDKAMAVSPVGLPVERLTQDQTVSSAVMVPDAHQVRFTCSSTGSMFVYDYELGRWTTHTGLGTVQDSVMWRGSHVVLAASSSAQAQKIWVEDESSYRDGTADVVTTLSTGWLPFANPLESEVKVHRLLILGEAKSAHTLSIQLSYDYVDTVVETFTVDSGTVVASGAAPFIPGVKIERLCKAIKVRISDSNIQAPAVAGDPAGLLVTALSFEVQDKQGRQPQRNSSWAQ